MTATAGEGVTDALTALRHTLTKAGAKLGTAPVSAHASESGVLTLTSWAEELLEARVNLNVAETSALLEEVLTNSGLPCHPFAGAFRTELDLGERGIPPLSLTVSVNRAGISFVCASGEPSPGGETKSLAQSRFELGVYVPNLSPPTTLGHARMVNMLVFNDGAGVVKSSLNRYGEVCLLYEVPSVFPGLVDHLVAEFLPLIRALRCSNGAAG